MSQLWMSHVTHMNESCHTYQWVMSQLWMSHVTHTNESCHTYRWVMSQLWMSHVTHTNESCHTYRWVMSQIWMSHVTHTSCHTHEHVLSHPTLTEHVKRDIHMFLLTCFICLFWHVSYVSFDMFHTRLFSWESSHEILTHNYYNNDRRGRYRHWMYTYIYINIYIYIYLYIWFSWNYSGEIWRRDYSHETCQKRHMKTSRHAYCSIQWCNQWCNQPEVCLAVPWSFLFWPCFQFRVLGGTLCMCIRVREWLCLYVCVYVFMCVWEGVCVYIYVYVCVNVCWRENVCVYICVCMCEWVLERENVCVCMRDCVFERENVCIYVCMYVCMCVREREWVCIYMCMYVWMRVWEGERAGEGTSELKRKRWAHWMIEVPRIFVQTRRTHERVSWREKDELIGWDRSAKDICTHTKYPRLLYLNKHEVPTKEWIGERKMSLLDDRCAKNICTCTKYSRKSELERERWAHWMIGAPRIFAHARSTHERVN